MSSVKTERLDTDLLITQTTTLKAIVGIKGKILPWRYHLSTPCTLTICIAINLF